MMWRIKDWLIRLTEPWREEGASLDLAWRIYAQKHNACGERPQCWYPGMDEEKGLELNPMDKVCMYEFPPGARQEPIDPDFLINDVHSDWYPMEKK